MAIDRNDINNKIILLDGAMGTMLQSAGMQDGKIPEEMNIESREIVIDIHKKYISAGADIITTNTFGANRIKLEKSKYELEDIIREAVHNAKEAAKGFNNVSIGLDIGPIGELLEPMGTLSFDEAYETFKEVVMLGEKYNVDLYLIETMTDLSEARAAVLAVKENSSKPVFCTMTFDESGRTFTGVCPESMCIALNALNVDAVGINCSLGPKEMVPVVDKILEFSKCPVIIQPNAGLPVSVNGKVVYNVKKEEFAEYVIDFVKKGASLVGGCCGTTDEYIQYLKSKLKGESKVQRSNKQISRVCTAARFVNIEGVKVVGERINPTGKKLFKEALRNNDLDYVVREAITQVKNGADILDVNVGLPEIDEKKCMVNVVKEIQSVTDVPLQIDSTDCKVIEAALRVYNGKAIVNSVNGTEESLNNVLPIVKKYGAAVVALALDDNGLPKSAEERIAIAKRIVKRAEEIGISKEDIIIDALTLTVSAQQNQAKETVKAVKYITDQLKLKTILGVSNISFGLPNRSLLNRTFLTMCLNSGLTLPIVNPSSSEIMDTIMAYKVFNMEDVNEENYVKHFAVNQDAKTTTKERDTADLKEIVIEGLKDEAAKATESLLQEKKELEVVNEYLIPALDIVGERYEKGIIFLPQLIGSAETVKKSFEVLKQSLKSKESGTLSKGKIIMATVKGDIHDIGKNIVKVILENYGYDIMDLGRDVDPEYVAEMVQKYDVKLVGLSALMTTTVKNMAITIEKIKDKKQDCKVFVGGAVLNEEYAKMINADFYARDAKESVKIAESVLRKH